MVTKQRLALFNLSVAAVTLVAFVALIPVLGAWRAQGAFALLALAGLAAVAHRVRRRGVVCDERDRIHQLRSVQIGFAVVWLMVVGGITGLCSAYGIDGAVPARLLTTGLYLTAIAFLLGQSATLLVLYRTA